MPPFLLPFIGPVIDKLVGLIPDKQAAEKARLEAQVQLEAQHDEIVKAFLASDQAQDAVNQAEAASGNKFSADWRPWIGWVCGAAFAWAYVVQPVASFILVEVHPDRVVHLPTIDFSSMSTVLMGMLGLAGLHTYKETNK